MTTAVLLALASGVLHALWNTLAKRMSLGAPATRVSGRGATLAILTAALVIMLFVTPFVHHSVPVSSMPWIALAGLGEAAYVASLGLALSKGDLGITYGVSRGAALLLVWPLGLLVFGDVPSVASLVATLLLVLGMVLCQAKTAEGARSMSLGWTLATGLSVGVYHTAYKGAARAGADAASAFTCAIAIALPLLWLGLGADVRTDARRAWHHDRGALVLAGVGCAASFVLAVVALSSTQSGRVLGLRNLSVGLTALFAYALGERPTSRQWLGLGLVLAGVVVLGLGG